MDPVFYLYALCVIAVVGLVLITLYRRLITLDLRRSSAVVIENMFTGKPHVRTQAGTYVLPPWSIEVIRVPLRRVRQTIPTDTAGDSDGKQMLMAYSYDLLLSRKLLGNSGQPDLRDHNNLGGALLEADHPDTVDPNQVLLAVTKFRIEDESTKPPEGQQKLSKEAILMAKISEVVSDRVRDAVEQYVGLYKGEHLLTPQTADLPDAVRRQLRNPNAKGVIIRVRRVEYDAQGRVHFVTKALVASTRKTLLTAMDEGIQYDVNETLKGFGVTVDAFRMQTLRYEREETQAAQEEAAQADRIRAAMDRLKDTDLSVSEQAAIASNPEALGQAAIAGSAGKFGSALERLVGVLERWLGPKAPPGGPTP